MCDAFTREGPPSRRGETPCSAGGQASEVPESVKPQGARHMLSPVCVALGLGFGGERGAGERGEGGAGERERETRG